MQITSLSNAKVKQWFKYHEKKHRDKDQRFLIEGEHLLQEAHRAGIIECIMVEIGCPSLIDGYPVYELTPPIMAKLSLRESKASLMALCRYPQNEMQSDRILMCDGVQDPGNLGTLIRTACSFHYRNVVLSKHCVDAYNEKVIRSTQGAQFHVNLKRCDLIDAIQAYKSQGYHIYATSLQNAKPLATITPQTKHVLIMGNEGKGVSEEVLALCDESIFIEMKTFESLNVAVAGGICMYELSKEE